VSSMIWFLVHVVNIRVALPWRAIRFYGVTLHIDTTAVARYVKLEKMYRYLKRWWRGTCIYTKYLYNIHLPCFHYRRIIQQYSAAIPLTLAGEQLYRP
jgi:hypothetical protein